ncbi:MAG: 4Fe-4S dicluster domain-containing protein [Hadesarchaea archaeon]|nr:4Fe-4S dicluster domain-containing protein [Hadesarchaea archaeon]TES83319.1 MAG: NADH-quinone oxidoreductase subunit I [Hadesarchaea archaeon]
MPRILPQVLRNLLRKPATVKYPQVRVEPPKGYRGRPVVDPERCISCWLCIRTCPARAITISKETKKPSIWLGRCIFCGECAEVCPARAITMTKEFEFTTLR